MTDSEKEKSEKEEKPKIPVEKTKITEHSIMIAGKQIDYTVQIGTKIIYEEVDKEEPKAKASIFYVAYLKKNSDLKRPLTFAFNGGPGSSSVWLHMGMLGPKRVIAEHDAKPVGPPYELVDNDYSILDLTDLVFIDPVITGFSRPVPGEEQEQFLGFQEDLDSVGEFIRKFTTDIGRWNSPKYLIGESYGTTRAAGLANYLQNKHSMYLNGIMLISSILNFQTARFGPGNDMPYLLFLPTYAATAWYHKMLDDELQQDLYKTLDKVKEFVMHDYTLALMKGDALDGEERHAIIAKLAKFTGLSEEYIEAANLRIDIHKFTKELKRKEHRTVGRLDSRFIGIDRDSTDATPEHDPSFTAIMGPYNATFNQYIRDDLEFDHNVKYEIIAAIWDKWSYKDHQNQYVNVGEALREAMSKNPFLKVFVANGFFDLATPFFATEYTFNHLWLDKSLRDNISMAYFEAGHMMYMHLPSLEKLKAEITKYFS